MTADTKQFEEFLTQTNIDAERNILGSMLFDKSIIPYIFSKLNTHHFFITTHQMLFTVLKEFFEKSIPIDFITLKDYLTTKNLLDDVGGFFYLLDMCDSIASTANIEFHIQILIDKFYTRELTKICFETQLEIKKAEKSISEIIDEHQAKVSNLSIKQVNKGLVDIKDDLYEKYKRVIDAHTHNEKTKPVKIISTGLQDLNNLLNGGIKPQQVIIIAARPGVGKTSFALNLALNIAISSHEPIAFFSLEMSRDEIITRLYSSDSEVPAHILDHGIISSSDYEKATHSIERLSNDEISIMIDETAPIGVDYLKACVRNWKLSFEKTGKTGVVFIDYLQLMTHPKAQDRLQEISIIARQLKYIAKDMNLPIIALSQLNRSVEIRGDKKPKLSDLRESGEIENSADIIGFLFRQELYEKDSAYKKQASFIIEKNRSGATGEVNLFFDATITKFSGLEF